MFFKQLIQSSTVRLALIALVLCGVSLVGSRSTGEAKAASGEVNLNQQIVTSDTSATLAYEAANPNSVQSIKGFSCQGSSVGTYFNTDLVIVFCAPGDGAIFAFAIQGVNSKEAARVVAIALAATATSHVLQLSYDTEATVPGCSSNNCRKLVSIGYSG